MKKVSLGSFSIGPGEPLLLIAGPCVIEGEEEALFAARALKEICANLPVNLVYKSSYDKANRTSIRSFRGPGLKKGLAILKRVKEELGLPVLTDVHTPEEAEAAAEVCDIIQIPAFLCRQTDLVTAAGRTGALVNVKKGQFLAPWDMRGVVDKLLEVGNERILLTERGTSFGYNNLVVDMRSIPVMQELGFPVCFDATHSVMLPGGRGSSSGGESRFTPILARAALAAGSNALFLEVHPEPAKAKSDKETVVALSLLPQLLSDLLPFYELGNRCLAANLS